MILNANFSFNGAAIDSIDSLAASDLNNISQRIDSLTGYQSNCLDFHAFHSKWRMELLLTYRQQVGDDIYFVLVLNSMVEYYVLLCLVPHTVVFSTKRNANICIQTVGSKKKTVFNFISFHTTYALNIDCLIIGTDGFFHFHPCVG